MNYFNLLYTMDMYELPELQHLSLLPQPTCFYKNVFFTIILYNSIV